mgnify:FL=1
MNKIIKLLIAIVYLICLVLILYAFFTLIDVTQITNYSYIREKSQILINYRDNNLIIFTLLFFLFCVFWILLLGFATPVAIMSGFIFGSFAGTIISVLGLTIGCTSMYILAKIYFRELIIKHLESKIIKFKNLFNKNEFLYFMIFRFAGGGGIPFAIQNVLPVIFDMKVKNYFYASLTGLVPSIFIINTLGSGIEKIIELNEKPSMTEIILNPEIYLPLLGFLLILIISYFLNKKFFKN